MKTAIIIFPGSNCDNEMERFLYKCTGIKPMMVWHKETRLPDVDLYVLPGGFSYGDYLRAGALANLSPIMKEIKRVVKETGKKVLGICNGFQILSESGLLEGTLLKNKNLKFICRNVHLKIINTSNKFCKNYKKENNLAKIQPFKGIIYNSERYKDDLSNVIAPPYDVIDAKHRNRLLGKHPDNIIRIILGLETALERSAEVYKNAADTCSNWLKENKLSEDRNAGFYVWDQTYSIENERFTNKIMFFLVFTGKI